MTQTIRKTTPKPFPDTWASGYGEDEYGYWQSFTFNGVRCCLRWINPGKFQMGSPDDEPERSSDETLHKVSITEGYWMADTACTQELWRAVMGANSSQLQRASLPVEQVSWADCQRFLDTINSHKLRLELRFPTEAEWEYACRAGTDTSFSFGANITTEQVNYNGSFPYNDGNNGEYQKMPVAVKSLPCNEWGLYEMHGNVWEWCGDWYAIYPPVQLKNPSGPDTGSSRILRGGSWSRGARYCRSAYRHYYSPDVRNNYIGFRFARSQKGVI